MSPTCRDCGATEGDYGSLVWAKTPKGAWVLVEPMLHLRNCKGRPKAHPKGNGKAPARPEYRTKVLDWALSQNWDRGWCEEQVDGAAGEDEVSVLKAVMAAKGKELLE